MPSRPDAAFQQVVDGQLWGLRTHLDRPTPDRNPAGDKDMSSHTAGQKPVQRWELIHIEIIHHSLAAMADGQAATSLWQGPPAPSPAPRARPGSAFQPGQTSVVVDERHLGRDRPARRRHPGSQRGGGGTHGKRGVAYAAQTAQVHSVSAPLSQLLQLPLPTSEGRLGGSGTPMFIPVPGVMRVHAFASSRPGCRSV